MKKIKVSWESVNAKVDSWAKKIDFFDSRIVVGVSRGGIVPAFMISHNVGAPFKVVDAFVEGSLKEFEGKQILLVDDICDTGATAKFFKEEAKKWHVDMEQVFLVTKYSGDKDTWFVFPWETESDTVGGREQATVAILRSIGEDPMREGLKDTPKRVARMWDEFSAGYKQDPKEILVTRFASKEYDAMIVLKDIHFYSLCEHHLLPFFGEVDFAYIPGDTVVGVSKIARLVECFAHRLQIQEKMTVDIGKAFEGLVKPRGVGVLIRATHLCMMMRGIKKERPIMKTSYLGGCFREEQITREEFLRLIK